jgi:hypothetical protein
MKGMIQMKIKLESKALVLQGMYADFTVQFVKGLDKIEVDVSRPSGEHFVLEEYWSVEHQAPMLVSDIPGTCGDYSQDSLSKHDRTYRINGHPVDESLKLKVTICMPISDATLVMQNITMGTLRATNTSLGAEFTLLGMVDSHFEPQTRLVLNVAGAAKHHVVSVIEYLNMTLAGADQMDIGYLSGKQEISLSGSSVLTIDNLEGTHGLVAYGADTILCRSVNLTQATICADGSSNLTYDRGAIANLNIVVSGADSVNLPQVESLHLQASGTAGLIVDGDIQMLDATLTDCAKARVKGSIAETKIRLRDVSSIRAHSYGTVLKKEVDFCASMKKA